MIWLLFLNTLFAVLKIEWRVDGIKNGKRKINSRLTMIVQVRDERGWDEDSSGAWSEKWSHLDMCSRES